MRVLLASTRGAGHVGPLLPFARALVRSGADVALAVPRFAAVLGEAASLEVLPIDDPPPCTRPMASSRSSSTTSIYSPSWSSPPPAPVRVVWSYSAT